MILASLSTSCDELLSAVTVAPLLSLLFALQETISMHGILMCVSFGDIL